MRWEPDRPVAAATAGCSAAEDAPLSARARDRLAGRAAERALLVVALDERDGPAASAEFAVADDRDVPAVAGTWNGLTATGVEPLTLCVGLFTERDLFLLGR